MTETPARKPMTTAQLEARCREIVARAVADGEAGKLDELVYRTLRDGLRKKGLTANDIAR